MPLPWRVRLAYAVGHVLNDVCASVWFTYTLVFFKFGVIIPTTLAGTVVLIGQVADGIATPLVGFFSDRILTRGRDEVEDETRDTNEESRAFKCKSCTRHFLFLLPSGRKAWHFYGSLLVIVSFPLLFGSPVGWMHCSTWAKMIYYLPIVIIFQVGWAAVQITHLALMNDLTLDPGERTLLTSLRYLFTVLSNLTVYLCTFFLLNSSSSSSIDVDPAKNSTVFTPSSAGLNMLFARFVVVGHPSINFFFKQENSDDPIDFGPNDLPVFRNLSLTIVGVGTFMTILFHLGVRNSDRVITSTLRSGASESKMLGKTFLNVFVYQLSKGRTDCSGKYEQVPIYFVVNLIRDHFSSAPLVTTEDDMDNSRAAFQINSWKDWLRVPLFWFQGFFYMTVRVIVNVSQVYITVYLLQSLHLPKKTMALIPLTIYLTSMVSLIGQKPIQDKISREFNTICGLLCVAIFCILTNYPGDPVQIYRVYLAAGILGIGCTIILITCLAMVSDLIGSNHENGAFVYGCMSFSDKLANGVVIQLIETLHDHISSSDYYQNVESYGIGFWVVAGSIFLAVQTAVKKRTYGSIHLFLLPENSIGV